MRSLKQLALVAVVGMAAFALLPPIANAGASQPASPVKASKKKKAKRVVLQRLYRGKTSQGQRVGLRTYNRRKVLQDLFFYAPLICKSASGGTFTAVEQFEQLGGAPLRGAAFAASVPSFDAEIQYVASVTGRAGNTTASGQAEIPARGDCNGTTFTFSIPKVKEVRERGRRR